MAVLLVLFGYGKIAAQAVGSWLSRRSLGEIVGLALGLLLLLDHAALLISHRENGKLKGQLHECTTARANDRAVYEKAQADATAKNKADLAAAAQKQKDISNAQVATLNDRLARLSDELRARGPAAQSHPVEPGVPQTGNASPGTPGAPGLCLSPDQLLRAAQDEERHNELIDWVLKQSSIDPNTGASAK
jgi:hypothetical protein